MSKYEGIQKPEINVSKAPDIKGIKKKKLAGKGILARWVIAALIAGVPFLLKTIKADYTRSAAAYVKESVTYDLFGREGEWGDFTFWELIKGLTETT